MGRATVIISFGFLIGEALAMGVLFRITDQMTYKAAFGLIGIISAIFSFSFLFIVREPKIHKTSTNYRKRQSIADADDSTEEEDLVIETDSD